MWYMAQLVQVDQIMNRSDVLVQICSVLIESQRTSVADVEAVVRGEFFAYEGINQDGVPTLSRIMGIQDVSMIGATLHHGAKIATFPKPHIKNKTDALAYIQPDINVRDPLDNEVQNYLEGMVDGELMQQMNVLPLDVETTDHCAGAGEYWFVAPVLVEGTPYVMDYYLLRSEIDDWLVYTHWQAQAEAFAASLTDDVVTIAGVGHVFSVFDLVHGEEIMYVIEGIMQLEDVPRLVQPREKWLINCK